MIQNQLESKYNKVIDKLFIIEKEDYIALEFIRIKDKFRNQSFAKNILRDLCDYAEERRIPILLKPEPAEDDLDTNIKKLINFYESFGFVPYKGKHKDYTLPPFYSYIKPVI